MKNKITDITRIAIALEKIALSLQCLTHATVPSSDADINAFWGARNTAGRNFIEHNDIIRKIIDEDT